MTVKESTYPPITAENLQAVIPNLLCLKTSVSTLAPTDTVFCIKQEHSISILKSVNKLYDKIKITY